MRLPAWTASRRLRTAGKLGVVLLALNEIRGLLVVLGVLRAYFGWG